MQNESYLLTIAIPTYNRASFLKGALDNITNDDSFDASIQIVISDNASTDNTKDIAHEYVSRFPQIKYSRNDQNIYDENFYTALNLSDGQYIKLHNDTVRFLPGSLNFIKETIRNSLSKKDPLLFYNKVIAPDENIYNSNENTITKYTFRDLDTLLSLVSHEITWITHFGIWKDSFSELNNPLSFLSYKLLQVDWTLQIASRYTCGVVYKAPLYKTVSLDKKGGYNLFEVFLNNYFSILNHFKMLNLLSTVSIKKEKKRIFNNFFLQWIRILLFCKNDNFSFEKDNAWKILLTHYKLKPFFWKEIIHIQFDIFFEKSKISSLFRKLKRRFIKIIVSILFPEWIRKAISCKLIEFLDIDYRAIHENELIKKFYAAHPSSKICFPWNCITGYEYISLGKNFHAASGLFLGAYGTSVDKPIIKIGNNVVINFDSQITAINSVIIGDDVLTGSRVFISDHSHGRIDSEELLIAPINRELYSKGPVHIGNRVWIGSNVAILPGVTIGDNCIIGVNSVVTKSFPANCVIAGNPAELLKVL